MRRIGDTLYDVLDQYTGEYTTYARVTKLSNGVDITDANTDGFIYRKFDTEYFVRNIVGGVVYMEWFGGKNDGVSSNATPMTRLINYLTLNGGGIVRLTKGKYNLLGATYTLPVGATLDFQGGVFINGQIVGNGSTITGNLQQPLTDTMTLRGNFKKSNTVYNYTTMTELKLMTHWPNKLCKTNGFHYENDGGGGEYIININSVFAAENIYFNDYWINTTIAGGAGAYVRLAGTLSAKYISEVKEVNLAVFGVKYDANVLNPTDKKYYTDATYTTEATDNYIAFYGAIRQTKFWAEKMMSKNLVATKTIIINTGIKLEHGAHEFNLRGNGYADSVSISSNVPLDALIENYYSATKLNDLTGTFYTIQDISFKGQGRVANGLVVKNGYEADGITRVQFHDFTNAGLVFYGISSTFKCDTISCFRNKHGVLITSTHPFRSTTNTQNVEGLISLYKVSGDYNTQGLITIDCTSAGASFNIQSIKSENNNNATILIKRSTPQQYISVKNAFTNGDGDFIKIENFANELPTIEIEGVFHNDSDADNWDVNDLKNNKQIRFFKNPTASFPHLIYTNNVRTYENGFVVYRNGLRSHLDVANTFGASNDRPPTARIQLGFEYYDTTLGYKIMWDGSTWIPITSTINIPVTVTTSTQQAEVNTKYVANSTELVVFTLPLEVNALIGDQVIIRGKGTGLWRLSQNASQRIRYTTNTTSGVGGYIQSSTINSAVVVEKQGSNDWLIVNHEGTITVA